MKDYLEKVLHQDVQLAEFEDGQRLPLACRNAFHLCLMGLNGRKFLVATPLEDMNLTELRKQQRVLERLTGYYCALYLVKMNYYAKEKMLSEGIPFIWEDHQVYLPFLGILLNSKDERILKPCERISFLTQKLLITAIYEDWQNITVTKAAERLNVSKISITRCFDEIQTMEIPYLKCRNRARSFCSDPDKKKMWEQIRPCLRSPVIAEFRLSKLISDEFVKAGISALAEYSMLSEDLYPTYAVAKAQIGRLKLAYKERTPKGEEPACVIQEMGYMIPFGRRNALDPLSLALSFSKDELDDPRVRISIDEMLEEYVW